MKKKLKLNKKILLSLSDAEKSQIVGGEAYTTSFSACTHFLCCGDTCTTGVYTMYPDPCYSQVWSYCLNCV